MYNSSNELVEGTDISGVGKISAFQILSHDGNSYSVSIIFRLRSNYIDITKNYIGESVKVNGNYVDIETEYDIFKGLISAMSFEYTNLSVSSQQVWNSISLSTANFTTGIADGNSYMQFRNTITINSKANIYQANLRIVLKDFVSDPQYYNPCKSKVLVIPLTIKGTLPKPGGEDFIEDI